MTIDEMYAVIKTHTPHLIYLSGKTSTGKSTFSRKLAQDLGYKVIELDQLVQNAVIKQFNLTDEGTAFVEVYHRRDQHLWVQEFVKATREYMDEHIQKGEHLIIEGAVANPITLSELFNGYQDPVFIYFHPDNIDSYIRNLTSRFLTTDEKNNGSLPAAFWKLIDTTEFKTFCNTRVISKKIAESIEKFALLSQEESEKRLKNFQEYFKDIQIIRI